MLGLERRITLFALIVRLRVNSRAEGRQRGKARSSMGGIKCDFDSLIASLVMAEP